MLGPALALASSLTGGVSDFLGGTTSRRIGTMQFMCCAQLVGAALAGGWATITMEPVPSVATLAAATGAGLGLTVGLAAFFQAMVVGTISIVAPISATGVIVPIVAGIAHGERPGAAQIVGMVVAIVGIVLASRPTRKQPSAPAESGVGLAFLAALGVGLFYWLMAPASHHGVAWTVFIVRAIPAFMLAAALGIRRASLRPALERPTVCTILAAGLLGSSSVALYALATLHGQLAIVSVLGSLFPVVTVLLAYRLLGERMRGAQQLGVVAVLVGVVLLST